MNVYDFAGRAALVTGGASGIGAAVVERLRDGGAWVAVCDQADAPAADLAIRGDVTRREQLDDAVARVEGERGALDVLVCAAGVVGEPTPTAAVSDEL